MKRIALATLTACLLFWLSAPVLAVTPAQGERRPYVIEIAITDGQIDMGEKYAYAVPPEANIRWTCGYAFEIQFDLDAPFETRSISLRAVEKKVKPDAKHLQLYKYTITVIKDGQALVLDPVIIVRPPQP